MKKIINGKKYDTDTAKLIGSHRVGNLGDAYGYFEELYLKKTGEYFVFGQGGPLSSYGVPIESNCWKSGERISPISVATATKWAERYLNVDEYEAVFGEVDE